MDLRLTDQVAFVAGSSRGIGRAIAERLLDEGARVVVSGRDQESVRATMAVLADGRPADRLLPIVGDLSSRTVIDTAVARILTTFGRLDHVVANVGNGRGDAGLDPVDDEWERLFEQNLFAATRLTQAVMPALLARRGSLLYIASIVAVEATAAPLPYCAAKAALVNYAKNLARRVGPHGVRVNSIAPGNILFEGGSWAAKLAHDGAAVQAMVAQDVPLQRFGEPDEIASLAAWLCSPLAGFATGGCYVVDGGQTRRI